MVCAHFLTLEEGLRELGRETERIEELLRSGEQATAEAAMTGFGRATGHLGGLRAGRRAADAPRVPDITREVLVEMVRRVLEAGPEQDHYLRLFAANVAHSGASGLIFHPPAGSADTSPDRIVDAALAHRPIDL